MSKKPRDDEVTQQIRVGLDALDEARRESAAATKRIQSSVPPALPTQESDECEEKERETQP